MMPTTPCDTSIQLSCEPHALAAWLPLLSEGVLIKARVPATIRGLLCGQLGVSREYVDRRINTLFLNGKAVDDVDNALVRNGASLALSASMPGFVGAAFRRGGHYASMRGNVSHREEGGTAEAEEGSVMLKLFNMTCPELGPLILAAGIMLDGETVERFFSARPIRFWEGCRSACENGREIDPTDLRLRQWTMMPGLVCLKVMIDRILGNTF